MPSPACLPARGSATGSSLPGDGRAGAARVRKPVGDREAGGGEVGRVRLLWLLVFYSGEKQSCILALQGGGGGGVLSRRVGVWRAAAAAECGGCDWGWGGGFLLAGTCGKLGERQATGWGGVGWGNGDSAGVLRPDPAALFLSLGPLWQQGESSVTRRALLWPCLGERAATNPAIKALPAIFSCFGGDAAPPPQPPLFAGCKGDRAISTHGRPLGIHVFWAHSHTSVFHPTDYS